MVARVNGLGSGCLQYANCTKQMNRSFDCKLWAEINEIETFTPTKQEFFVPVFKCIFNDKRLLV